MVHAQGVARSDSEFAWRGPFIAVWSKVGARRASVAHASGAEGLRILRSNEAP